MLRVSMQEESLINSVFHYLLGLMAVLSLELLFCQQQDSHWHCSY